MTEPQRRGRPRRAAEGIFPTSISLPAKVKEWLDGQAAHSKRSRSNVALLCLGFCMSHGISVTDITESNVSVVRADRRAA